MARTLVPVVIIIRLTIGPIIAIVMDPIITKVTGLITAQAFTNTAAIGLITAPETIDPITVQGLMS